jgi:hypothetical protein
MIKQYEDVALILPKIEKGEIIDCSGNISQQFLFDFSRFIFSNAFLFL